MIADRRSGFLIEQTGCAERFVLIFGVKLDVADIDIFMIAGRVQSPKIRNLGIGLMQAIGERVAMHKQHRFLESSGFLFDAVAHAAVAVAVDTIVRPAGRLVVVEFKDVGMKGNHHPLRRFGICKQLLQPFFIGLIAIIRFIQRILDIRQRAFSMKPSCRTNPGMFLDN